MTFWTVVLLLLAGGIATSLAEYFIHYNLVDKAIDLFRSAEVKAENAIAKAKKLESEAAAHLNKIRDAVRGR